MNVKSAVRGALKPSVEDVFPIRWVIFPFSGCEDKADLQSEPRSAAKVNGSRTSSGGFKPHFFARSHRCSRVMPTLGPYFEVMSNTRRISGESAWKSLDRAKTDGGCCYPAPHVLLMSTALQLELELMADPLGFMPPISALAAFINPSHSLLFTSSLRRSRSFLPVWPITPPFAETAAALALSSGTTRAGAPSTMATSTSPLTSISLTAASGSEALIDVADTECRRSEGFFGLKVGC